MGKPRLFIPIIQHFGVRYMLRTGMLEKLSEFVDPIIGISWDDPDLKKEYLKVGAEIVPLPPFEFDPEFNRIKERVNSWHREFRNTPTTRLKARSEWQRLSPKEKFKKVIYSSEDALRLMLPGGLERMFNDYERLLSENTNFKEFEVILLKMQPDAFLSLTPYINREEPLLRAAKKHNIRCFTSILSFDNITSRNWMPVQFDHYMVWNNYNVMQLLRGYPGVKAEQITVTGAPQFDFYYDKSYCWDEQDWRKRLKIPAERPVILFGGGTAQLIPNEPVWLQQLDEDITSGKIPGNPVVLFRRHPGDIKERWESVLDQVKNVVSDEPWQAKEQSGHTNITRTDIEDLTSALKHCVVHINTVSTMTVDGAVFDRPQIGPAYDANPQKKHDRTLRELYQREHFQPIVDSGGLDIVYNREELNQAIFSAMENPQERAEGRKKIVSEICTFNDGKSTERVVKTLKSLLS
jgi:hypothetical protein